MEELYELLADALGESLLHMVISGQRSAAASIKKIKIRPLKLKENVMFQAASWDGKKEFHKNYGKAEAIAQISLWLEREFRQLQVDTTDYTASVLVSKKGKVTVKKKLRQVKMETRDLTHNRKKTYLLEEGLPVPFLIDLGVMNEEGKVLKAKYDKFRQINRFLEFVADVVPELPRGRQLTMIDFGCGKSYLTFAMYYYLNVLQGLDVRMIGLDLKEDVIEHCARLADKYGYDKLTFLKGDIASYDGVSQVDLVVSLHACDTATDYALAKAVKWGAKAILSVPCCQHELNGQIKNDLLSPVLQYGLIKERMAALITDGLRAACLEEQGYQVQVMEFIDMEHTPKNILIRGIYTGRRPGEKAAARRRELVQALSAEPTLMRLLSDTEGEAASGDTPQECCRTSCSNGEE